MKNKSETRKTIELTLLAIFGLCLLASFPFLKLALYAREENENKAWVKTKSAEWSNEMKLNAKNIECVIFGSNKSECSIKTEAKIITINCYRDSNSCTFQSSLDFKSN